MDGDAPRVGSAVDQRPARRTGPVIEHGRCYGSTDVPLDERTFAAELPEIARLLPDDALIVSSPLARCRRLADALNTRRGRGEVLIDRALRERSYGDWEGTRWDDIARAQIDAWRDNFLDYAPPRGESVLALQTRVVAAAQRWSSAHATALIVVAHAGPLAVLRALLRRESLGVDAMQSTLPCGSILEFRLGVAASEIRLR